MTTRMKQCTKCHRKFPATTEYFYKRKEAIDGLRGDCKQCKITNTVKNKNKR